MAGFRRRVRHARGSNARGVRKERALNTDHGGSSRAPGHSLGLERFGHDRHECRGDLREVEEKNKDCADEVDTRHERNGFRCDLADRLHAADDDEREEDAKDHTHDPAIVEKEVPTELLTEDHRGLVRLKHVSAAEHAEESRDRVEHRENAAGLRPADLFEPIFEEVHRACVDRSVFVDHAVFRAQGRLGHLEAHRKEAEDRDPQCGARPAEPNRDRDARDVAKPDRA